MTARQRSRGIRLVEAGSTIAAAALAVGVPESTMAYYVRQVVPPVPRQRRYGWEPGMHWRGRTLAQQLRASREARDD